MSLIGTGPSSYRGAGVFCLLESFHYFRTVYQMRETTLSMSVLDLRNYLDPSKVKLPRAQTDPASAAGVVEPILEQVRTGGLEAVLALGEKFDRVRPPALRVPLQWMAQCAENLDPLVRSALEESIVRARKVHTAQLPSGGLTEVVSGGRVWDRWVPVERAGLYVPGGRAVYPSSVVMNAVPAQVAGVSSLAVVSPPQADHGGWPHPHVLAACYLLGIEEVYATGGAQAIGMLAYGLEDSDCPVAPVDVITGPGNVYVAAAKRAVQSIVAIDAEAGPTEVMVLADHTAQPLAVAFDLVSQAEHDPLAAAVLVTDSVALAAAVNDLLPEVVATTKHFDRIATSLTGPQSCLVLVENMEAGLKVADGYAAEHLEIHCQDALGLAMRVRNAGAVFVGTHSPVSLGDYLAGSNHVLPTSGTAKQRSGLSVYSFLKRMQIVSYDLEALEEITDRLVALAQSEDLPAHGQAVQARRELRS